jgi:hypothetical protein
LWGRDTDFYVIFFGQFSKTVLAAWSLATRSGVRIAQVKKENFGRNWLSEDMAGALFTETAV